MKPENKDLESKEICRALLSAAPADSGYDFEAVAVPVDNKQLRYSYRNDEYFYQVLRTGRENIKSDRLDSGLPVFDNHPYDKSAINTLGITTDYEFTDKGIAIRAKWGARADDALKSDVRNGILKTVSIEGDVYEYEVERKEGMIPVYYATLWEPHSISIAPVPQDITAQVEVRRAIQKQIEKKSDNISIVESLTSKF